MASIKYRSCSFEGTRAAAILTFREAVAQAVADVQTEVRKLDSLTTTRRDEAVVMNGQIDSTLLKKPLLLTQAEATKRDPFALPPYSSLVVRSLPGSQGATYRKAPFIEKKYDTTTVNGTVITQGRGGLRETFESAFAQWMFQNPDGTASAAGDNLTDSSFFDKKPVIHSDLPVPSAPSISDGGPLGFSRTFDSSTYFTIPTGVAITTVSQSLMMIQGEMAAWGWVNPAGSGEQVILSMSSPPADPAWTITSTANVVNGSMTVTVTALSTISRYCRIIFDPLQPDRMYEVSSISGLTLTLSEPYTGPTNPAATMVLAYSKALGVVHPPECRNTLYALSVQQQGPNAKVRLYWQRHNRVTVEATNTNVPWVPGQYLFAGYQRRQRKLAGTFTRSGITVTGDGATNFITEFGSGPVVEKYIRFVSTGLGDLDGDTDYRILNVASPTSLTLDVPNPLKDFTGQVSSQRILIHAATLDGTFNTQIVDHMPGPTGGLEPEPVTRNVLADFHIGRDFQYGAATNFTGSMNSLSMYLQPIDLSEIPGQEDQKIRRMYTRCFPDYIAGEQTIRRTAVTDITDGQTVYCDYDYATGITATRATTDQVTANLDDMLIGLNNPNVKNTSQLAQAIGTPDPAQQDNIDQLNRSMSKFGMLVANGQPILKGSTDMSAYNALAQTVGSVTEADKLVLGKPRKTFVLVAITEDVKEVASVDSCGRPSTTVLITERIVGVNKNLFEAAILAGFSNPAPLRLKLWWIGSVGNADSSIQKMRLLGMTGAQIADALSVTSSEKMKVFVIPVPDVAKKLRDGGVSATDVNAIATRAPTTSGTSAGTSTTTSSGTTATTDISAVNTNPGVGVTATAVQTAMAAPSGVTIDGDPNPLDPALVTARTIDLGKALSAKIDDLITNDILNAADKDCQALIAIVDDMLQNLTRTLEQVNQAIVPFAMHGKASVGNQKLAFQKYVPCVANVSASFALPPFHIKIDFVTTLLKHLLEQASVVIKQAEAVASRFNTLLCIPRTLIAALRGGVCGIEQPKVVANRQCPTQLDLLLDRLQALVDTIELLLRKVLLALTSFGVDIELTGGAASQLAVDATLPCIGPVANFLLHLG